MDEVVEQNDDEDLCEDGCVHEFHRVLDWCSAARAFFRALAERWPSGYVVVHCAGKPASEFALNEAHLQGCEIGVVTILRRQGVPEVFPPPSPDITPDGEGPIKLHFWAEGPDVGRIWVRTPGWADREPAYGEHDAFSGWIVHLMEGITGRKPYLDYGLMNPGGYDSEVGDVADVEGAVTRFLSALALRWPTMIIDTDDDRPESSRRLQAGERLPELSDGTWIFMFRDEAMIEHRDETGGRPMPDGDGPLTLVVGKQDDGAWRMTLVTPEDSEEDPFSVWARETLSAACGRDVSPIRYTDDEASGGSGSTACGRSMNR